MARLMRETHEPSGARYIIWPLIICCCLWLGVASLPVMSLFVFKRVTPETQATMQSVLQQWGTFGDMFNTLNSLITAGALSGIIYTAVLQRRQITMQAEELRMARRQFKMAEEQHHNESERQIAEAMDRDAASKDRVDAQQNAKDQKVLALRAAILNAKTAILTAEASIPSGGLSQGHKQEWITKAQASIDDIRGHMMDDIEFLKGLTEHS